jgi:hypothetical protein
MAHLKSSLVAVILAVLPKLVLADPMRCGSELITAGTSQAKVAALCGEPVQVAVSDADEEIWVYNFGPNKLMQRIWFRNGVVAGIDSIGYGY